MPDGWKAGEGGGREDDRRGETSTRILVVDDEPCILRFFSAIFPLPGYLVAVAADDKLALQLTETQVFDLAFVDYFLGEVNGAEVAQKLRDLQPELKIVLMSGYVVNDRAAELEVAGASAFLTKPFSVEAAQHVVARLLHGIEHKLPSSMNADSIFPISHA
ncbi:MAG: response regulator [Verrucomicrobiia bacterium]|jgi:CheY-like chemotaxis protein